MHFRVKIDWALDTHNDYRRCLSHVECTGNIRYSLRPIKIVQSIISNLVDLKESPWLHYQVRRGFIHDQNNVTHKANIHIRRPDCRSNPVRTSIDEKNRAPSLAIEKIKYNTCKSQRLTITFLNWSICLRQHEALWLIRKSWKTKWLKSRRTYKST